MKRKGSDAERELIKLFWSNGWAALRAPGSGSAQHPSPDVIAGNKSRTLAIECKVTKEEKKYIEKAEIEQLIEFSGVFGAEPWVGVKLASKDWYFLSLDDLEAKKNSFLISRDYAKKKGLLFEELIGFL